MARGWETHPWHMTRNTGVYGGYIFRQDPENPGEPTTYQWQVHDLYTGPYGDRELEKARIEQADLDREYGGPSPEGDFVWPLKEYKRWVDGGRKMTFNNEPVLAEGAGGHHRGLPTAVPRSLQRTGTGSMTMYMMALYQGFIQVKTVRTFRDDHDLKSYIEAEITKILGTDANDTQRWNLWRRHRLWVTSSDTDSRPIPFSAADRYAVGMGKCPEKLSYNAGLQ